MTKCHFCEAEIDVQSNELLALIEQPQYDLNRIKIKIFCSKICLFGHYGVEERGDSLFGHYGVEERGDSLFGHYGVEERGDSINERLRR